ncbi:MAG: DUF4231 domain-containing protein [Bacteroidales bacterium]|nr:DUF4231 domain-containing protein [Bacteroidales bacterium]MCF8403261.1 DUF4231 domain-containing protein [Bacteroidales bacterium]
MDVNDQRIEKVKKLLIETIEEIKSQKTIFKRRSNKNRRRFFWFKIIITILAVIAPSLVTYTTQHNSNQLWAIIAICVTAIAGASATLQSILDFGDRFRREAITFLKLDKLFSSVNIKMEETEFISDVMEKYHRISQLNESARTELNSILRNHIESEIAFIISVESEIEKE